jgi:uncharacterized protein (TIGR02145 family)
MSGNICKKSILKSAGISILAVLFYTACDDNGVKVVTPEVRTFIDGRDGKVYKEVTIGTQRWMAENLNYEADGSTCYDITWSPYDDPAQHCETYGRLYDWNTAMDYRTSSDAVPSGVEGVCPVGWHIPSDAEWTILTDFVGINAGTKLKSRTFHDGNRRMSPNPNPNGTDKYRFSALDGEYASTWWSSTEMESDGHVAWIRNIDEAYTVVRRFSFDKRESFLSVRCVHD